MKVATANDKPEWFTPPYGVTTATICRISGKLAAEGCDHAEVIGKDGQIETRSMVYTEYFSRGTEPTEYCDMHTAANGAFGTVAGVFAEPPPRVVDHGDRAHSVVSAPIGTSGTVGAGNQSGATSTPNVTNTSGTIDQIAPLPPDRERKSGFWRRILGRGRDGKKN
jgi:hypothetical protein